MSDAPEPVQKPDNEPEFYHSTMGYGDVPSPDELKKVLDETAAELIG